MKYTKKQFLADVAKEAKALKKNATAKELWKLDLGSLDAHSRYECIYGTMTGECRTDRAVELITKCCKRFIQQKNGFIPTTFDTVKQFVNGTKSEEPRSATYLSTIESYIALPDAKNANLIAYLKGERNDLVL